MLVSAPGGVCGGWIEVGRRVRRFGAAVQDGGAGARPSTQRHRTVLAGLVPAIHADAPRSILQDAPDPNRVDGRDKPGQDRGGAY